MTASVLPPSPTAFAKATWDDVAPYFDDLLERPLDAGTVQGWLLAWSRLEELVTEAAAQADRRRAGEKPLIFRDHRKSIAVS